ncbi:hypothetical protein RND71_014403 [Anisodus tanguticus]|uniref:Uncharacterized protein n=1 Tax=Anisodus tanguticus TaxID=243964 RepID=A0AAE1S9P3_9SOLA|nr:hypothetical protein RND71_014403 [Anisodus tanguticus]
MNAHHHDPPSETLAVGNCQSTPHTINMHGSTNIKEEIAPADFFPTLQHLGHRTDTEHLEKFCQNIWKTFIDPK